MKIIILVAIISVLAETSLAGSIYEYPGIIILLIKKN